MSEYQIKREQRPVSWLRHYEPNPRRLKGSKQFTALCRSIAAFGLVQTICALDDGRVLGGNQTLDALAQLKRGFDAPRPDGGTDRIQWEPSGGVVDVMVVCGASAEQAMAINLALNRHAGEDVEDEVARVLRDLQGAAPHLLRTIDSDEEIERLLRADDEQPSGDGPRTRGVPSITLQFTSAAAHTRVKQALSAAGKRQKTGDGEARMPSGDLLDAVLREREGRAKVRAEAPVPAPAPAAKKAGRRPRADN